MFELILEDIAPKKKTCVSLDSHYKRFVVAKRYKLLRAALLYTTADNFRTLMAITILLLLEIAHPIYCADWVRKQPFHISKHFTSGQRPTSLTRLRILHLSAKLTGKRAGLLIVSHQTPLLSATF